MDGLAAFLTARLDEDDAAARAAASDDPRARSWADGKSDYPLVEDGWHVVVVPPGSTWGQVRHIARHDPARALREVAFKRAILGGLQTAAGWSSDNWPLSLRLFAAIYSDHPDYLPEWKP